VEEVKAILKSEVTNGLLEMTEKIRKPKKFKKTIEMSSAVFLQKKSSLAQYKKLDLPSELPARPSSSAKGIASRA
jgi:hypothetical protein